MSDETFAAPTSTEPGPALTPPSEEDYDAICAAVMETVRGRWFLSEYSRRNRHADTELVLSALDRIETTLRGERTSEDIDRLRHDLTEMAKAITLTKSEIAAIKIAAPRAASYVLDRAIQAYGGAGVSADTPLAAMWAGVRTLHLADGPDEVHLRSIARLELGRARERLRG